MLSHRIREMICFLENSRRFHDNDLDGYPTHSKPPYGDADYIPVSHNQAEDWVRLLKEILDAEEKR